MSSQYSLAYKSPIRNFTIKGGDVVEYDVLRGDTRTRERDVVFIADYTEDVEHIVVEGNSVWIAMNRVCSVDREKRIIERFIKYMNDEKSSILKTKTPNLPLTLFLKFDEEEGDDYYEMKVRDVTENYFQFEGSLTKIDW